MAYRYDKDLEFLKELSSPELDELVKILTHDKDGKVRFTEELTNNDLYKKHYPDHKEYIELILEEFQKFGVLIYFEVVEFYIMKFYAMLQKNLM
ncbi:DUF3944 domain-containing protein [Campylobacter jejuni]